MKNNKSLPLKTKKSRIVLNGIITENPVFRLVLGTCPTLAVTTSALNAVGMGCAVIFVLVLSNILISALRKLIPSQVRIPAYVLIVATFVTVVDMVVAKFIPSLYQSLGLFIPLIVVNCLILGRAEAYASKHSIVESALDGLGMGLGFLLGLLVIAVIREFLGAGSFFGIDIPYLSDNAVTIFLLPAGGFLVYGLLMASVNAFSSWLHGRRGEK